MTDELTQDQLDEIASAAAKEAVAAALAQQAYGGPVGAAGVGNSQRATPEDGSWEASENYVLGKLKRGDGLNDSKSKQMLNRWIPDRLRLGIRQGQENPSYKHSRPGTAEDLKIRDDRTRRAANR